ncbi:MAG: MerR family transcriptional regulator [Steroidobacteraceae bacterium]|jgi:DNA-binding transcriptional MerR regulator|nr:MerR family transcriptional regulator [Steroidobacteraceae bacterium]
MFTIKAVSQATGVSIETLRAWERRYRIVEPARDANGRRSYRPEDVIRLRKLREATERGHTISKLARFSDEELSKLLEEPELKGAKHAASQSFAQQILAAAENYRPDDCDQVLSMALALLPLSEVVSQVLSPVLLEVGERWHAGTLNIAQERIVTSTVRKQVSTVLDTYNRIASGPLLVLTTLSGERHELGILMCALLAASRGLRCQYLGPDMPASDLAIYLDRVGATAVALSFVLSDNVETSVRELNDLARQAPSQVEIWIGGLAAKSIPLDRMPGRCRMLPDYPAFERQVEVLGGRAP